MRYQIGIVAAHNTLVYQGELREGRGLSARLVGTPAGSDRR